MRGLTRPEGDLDVNVWPSYTDVAMNIILILLIYLFTQVVVASQTSAALVIIRERQTSLKEEIQEKLPEDVRRSVAIHDDGNLLQLTFSDRVLFASGEAALTENGKRIMGQIGKILERRLSSFSQIQVEGHTDNVPIRTKFQSNWELSSARATTVVEFLTQDAGIQAAKMSATGYSEYHPVASNNSEEGRARNRRIELVIVYSMHDAKRQ
jgi:chemotaxis protein MotB